MPGKIELSATELAHLDLLIEDKKTSGVFVQALHAACTPTAMAHVENMTAHIVTAVNGSHKVVDHNIYQYLEIGNNTSLDKLLDIRKRAILKE